MRLKQYDIHSREYQELDSFNKWIIDIGNGNITYQSKDNAEEDQDTTTVQIPDDLLLTTTGNKIQALVQYIYPDF